jgi:hypothetical protein
VLITLLPKDGELSNASVKREKTMERKIVERRTVLKGGAAAVGMLGSGASASIVAGVQQASADTPPSSVPDQILAAFQRFRETIPANFDHEYVEKAVRPFFLTSFYEGERPMLPVIDVTFSKENALPTTYGDSLPGTGDRPLKTASRSFCRVLRNVAPIISVRGFTSRG